MKRRVFVEFDASVLGGEAPVDFTVGLVAAQGVPVADATGQTLTAQHAQLDLCDAQPAAVLGRVVKFKALQPPQCGHGLKRLADQSRRVGVDVTLLKHVLFGLAKMFLGQRPQALRIMDSRTSRSVGQPGGGGFSGRIPRAVHRTPRR